MTEQAPGLAPGLFFGVPSRDGLHCDMPMSQKPG